MNRWETAGENGTRSRPKLKGKSTEAESRGSIVRLSTLLLFLLWISPRVRKIIIRAVLALFIAVPESQELDGDPEGTKNHQGNQLAQHFR